MNKIVYLVRHGLIRSNEEDVYAGRNSEKLTERGKNRAEQLGLEIEGWGIQLIQTSPLRRTVQTAEILNKYCNAELIKDPDLIEIDLGPWSGLSKDEVRRRYPDYYKTWIEHPEDFDQPGVESLESVKQRVVHCFERFLASERRIAAFVTHSVAVKVAVLYYEKKALNLYHKVDVPNLSVHRITFEQQGNARVMRLK